MISMLSKNGCKLLSIDEQYIYLYNGMRRFPHAKGSEGPKGSNAQKVSVGTKRCLFLCLLYKYH